MTSSEEKLAVAQAQAGDEQAFRLLYESQAPRLKKILWRMSSNEADAEDLLADTFVSIFRKLRFFEGRSSFGTWAWRIALNTFYMSVRKRKLETVDLDPVLMETLFSDRMPAVSVLDLDKLRDLAPGYLKVLILRGYYGLEHKEVAKVIHRSTGNCKSQFSHAKAAARKLMTA
jgi:RNA polymerase sigma factor (sigma-70 family)